MPSGLRAIETEYKGYRFRSRIEARWAVFFDALGIAWEYEREGYELESSQGRYLPDFWLPDHRYWIEIKGAYPSLNERKHLSEFARGMPNDEVYLFCGSDFRVPYMNRERDFRMEGAWGRYFPSNYRDVCVEGQSGQVWAQCTDCMMEGRETFGIMYGPFFKRHARKRHGWGENEPYCGGGCDDTRQIVRAYRTAQQARFEFGESGPPR